MQLNILTTLALLTTLSTAAPAADLSERQTAAATTASKPFSIGLNGYRWIGASPADYHTLGAVRDRTQRYEFQLTSTSELRVKTPGGKEFFAGVKRTSGKDLVYVLMGSEAGTHLKCSLDQPAAASGAVVCSVAGSLTYPIICNDNLYMSSTRYATGCDSVVLTASPSA